tara:strand:+ start:210 stop:728 length:519 start_codon:yes stop_codon:yes gene_type:complete
MIDQNAYGKEVVLPGMKMLVEDLWEGKPLEWQKRMIRQWFYMGAFSFNFDTKLISLQARSANKKSRDHIFVPEFTGFMIAENPDPFLYDEDLFLRIWNICCCVVKVTKTENKSLSGYTKGSFIKCGAIDRYKKENIVLYHKKYGIMDTEQAIENFIKPPKEYFELEKKYIKP